MAEAETPERMPYDFHIYMHADGSMDYHLDQEDPQREEISLVMADVFEKHKRFREASECRGIGVNG
jgi:hypothetical protein